MNYEAVIGLEIHVQLNCPTKMFCDCPNRPGDRPNQNICPICLWLPGALPQLSRNAVEKATLTCLALNCDIQPCSVFDQKVYYYPDLPKGFQLSQFHYPLARNGWLEILGEDEKPKRLRIHEIHMEEDVAKLVHETEGSKRISLVDFNRAGSPLVEIVTEPDMRGPHDAMEFLRALRTQIRYVDTAECSMERGTVRVDANISIRPHGSDEMNTKVEVKNMNSIRHVGDAIAYEIKRQTERVNAGEAIRLHTRLWDPEKEITTPMRGKFSGPCVPDPSVPDVVITESWLNELRSRLPMMPAQKREEFVKQYQLTQEEATLMSAERETAEYFEALAGLCQSPRTAAHWISGQLLPALKDRNQSIAETPITPQRLASLLRMIEAEAVNANAGREVFTLLFESNQSAEEIVAQKGLKQVTDATELEAIAERLIAANPGAVEDFRAGKEKSIGFLVGQAMRASQGKANPKLMREIFLSKLS
ncbi:MAG: Asp-tRNA(Asn)/Glu-tRNA(Gln) amidotransferase subunit GatB [Candidatus Omnitrophota bacterium]|jgi:aspartyl-tRNA(Asn)/glutamyl-tRNA(Gln) amidotransferase subunit B|nr:MAG: Asp-tRNA(Asn)/Glu-tRNA(Gln) amidotransferase subunit GatB [Candidatus Omnitrophota bacterium]